MLTGICLNRNGEIKAYMKMSKYTNGIINKYIIR